MAAITHATATPLSLASSVNLQTRRFRTPASTLGNQMNYGCGILPQPIFWRLIHFNGDQPQGNIYCGTSGIPQKPQCSSAYGSPPSEVHNMNVANVKTHLHPGFSPATSGSPSCPGTEQSHTQADSMALEPVSTKELTRSGTKYYICSCGHETRSRGDMSRHHESRKHCLPKYTCLCGKKFTRKYGRTRHEKKCKRNK